MIFSAAWEGAGAILPVPGVEVVYLARVEEAGTFFLRVSARATARRLLVFRGAFGREAII